MTCIARFYRAEEAHLFRSLLESEGIRAHLLDENFAQLNWFYPALIGGLRIVVDPSDAERAAELYKHYDEKLSEADLTSGEIKHWPLVLLASLAVSIPLLIFGRKMPRT